MKSLDNRKCGNMVVLIMSKMAFCSPSNMRRFGGSSFFLIFLIVFFNSVVINSSGIGAAESLDFDINFLHFTEKIIIIITGK